jgi:hypothetical protein
MQENKKAPESSKQELHDLVNSHGFMLEEVTSYALVNASGHIRLYPDLITVVNALNNMVLKK